MPNNNNRINFQVGYNVDQASVNAVKKSLQDLQNIKLKDFSGTKTQLDQIKKTAGQVESALTKAFNVNLNSLNTQQFNASLKEAGLSVDKIYTSFSKAGAQGQVAFSRMASEVLTTNMQLKQTNSLVSQMGETMANTVKWGIASSIMNNFTNSVQQAFQYVKSLDSALTDIRIVTGDSTEQMKEFAVQANNAAQSLGRSTMDYTKAALTFYQQGLNEEDVQARTQAVLKAQNITGAGDEMADYLTAVWNGYKVANEEAELYVDKLASVADSSASNMSQLAIAMSKVASTANAMGVDVDQLNAQIATIVATTRQAPESVGNALKTIYSRINDISTDAEDAEVSLGNYSKQMKQVGFDVLDANGNLRDTGEVIEEIGGKWADLSREEQIYLARTMAGQRQYNNLIALFDNWSRYSDLVNVSMDSQGTLMEKNSRYMESLGAKMEQLGAAGERVKSAMINEEDLKGLVDFGTGAVNLFGNLIESIGGGRGALLAFGSIFTQVFSGTIAKQINNAIINAQNYKHNLDQIRQAQKKVNQAGQNSWAKGIATEQVKNLQQMQKYWKVLSNEQKQSQQDRAKQIQSLRQQQTILKQNTNQAKKFFENISGGRNLQNTSIGRINNYLNKAKQQLLELNEAYETVLNLPIKENGPLNNEELMQQQTALQQLAEKVRNNVNLLGENATQNDKALANIVSGIAERGKVSEQVLDRLLKKIQDLQSKVNHNIINVENFNQNQNQFSRLEQQANRLQQEFNRINQGARQAFDTKAVVNFAAGLGQVASGISNIKNLGDIWSRKDLSTGQKMLQTMTNIGMTIPMLVNGLKLMRTSWGGVTDSIKLAVAQIMVRNGAIVAADAGATAAQMSLATAIKTVTASILASPLAPFIAVVAAVGVAIYAMYKQWNREAEAAQKAAQVAQKTKETYDDLKSTYDNLKSSLEDYNSAQEAISEMTKGTQEWRDAIRESNDAVLDLIQSYPELASEVQNVNGQLVISAQAQQEALQKAAAAVDNARLASISTAAQSRDASLRANARESGRFAGQITYSGQFIQATTDQIMNLVEAYSTATDRSVQALAEQTGMSEQLVSSILTEVDNMDQLVAQLQANTEATKLSYEAMASERLQGNKVYEGLDDLGKQVAQAIAGQDLMVGTDINQFLTTDDSFKQLSKFSSASEDYMQDILDRFRKAMGDATIDWASNAAQGFGGKQLHFMVDGQELQYTKEQVAATIAASEALQDLTGSVEKARDVLNDIGDISNQSNATALKDFIGNQGFGNLTSKQLNELDPFSSQMESFFEEHALQLGYNTGQEFQQAFIKGQKAAQKDWDLISEDSFPPVKDIVDKLLNKNEFSLQTAQKIGDSLDAAFKQAGNKGIQSLGALFNNTEQNIDELAKVIASSDLSTPEGLQQLKQDIEAIGDGTIVASGNWDWFTSVIENTQFENPLDSIFERQENINKVTKGLNKYSIISEEDYNTLLQINPQIDAMFSRVAEGYQFIGQKGSLMELLTGGTNGYIQAAQQFDKLKGSATLLARTFEEDFQASLLQGNALSNTVNEAIQHINIQKSPDQLWATLGFDEDYLKAQLEKYSELQQQIINKERSGADTTADIEALQELEAELQNFLNSASQLPGSLEGVTEALREAAALGAQSLSELNELLVSGKINGQQFGEALEKVSHTEMGNLGFDTEQYQNWVRLLQATQPQLEQNQYLARALAKANMRISEGMQELSSNWQTWRDALLDFKETGDLSTLVESWGDLRATLANIFDADAQSIDLLGPNFIANNLDKIEAVKNGTERAYEELSNLMNQQLIVRAHGVADFSELDQGIQQAYQMIWEASQNAEIQVGAVFTGDDDMIAAFNRIVEGANWTQEQAQKAFSKMGYNVEFTEEPGTTHTRSVSTQHYVPPTYSTQPLDYDLGPFGSGTLQVPYVAVRGHYADSLGGVVTDVEPAKYSIKTVTKNGNGFGGNISRRNVASAAPRTSSRPSGGGGSKGSAPKAATQAKVSTTKIENTVKTPDHNPYEQEQKSYQRQSKILDELQDQQKKLVNKDRLKNLQAQNKTLREQEKILNRELDISKNSAYENSTADYARRLGQQFKDALSFDADGQISDVNKLEQRAAENYNAAAKAAVDAFNKEKEEYNNYILNTWNAYGTQDEQELHKAEKEMWDQRLKDAEQNSKNAIKAAEEEYKTREDLINSYTKAWEADQKRLEQIKEIQDQIIENQIAASKIKVDLAIDTGDFERDWLDFENKFIKKLDKDDFLGNAKASAKELMSYFNSDQIQETSAKIKQLNDHITRMKNGGTSQIYGNNLAQAQEDLEDYMKQQMDDLGDVQDLIDDIKDNYLDALDNAKDKMDDQIDQYERVNDLIEHNVKLTQMLYGDKAYDTMNKYYELQKANNKDQLESLRMQQQYWQDLMKNQTKNSPAWNQMKKNLDDVTDNLNSKLEDMIENLSDQWQNRVDGIIAKLNNALTGGRGLNYLDEQWDYINNFDDNFLDTFESKMGIQEVTDLYQQAIDGLSGSPANQQKINKLMNEQLKILREKDNLTQYDIDRAKAALEVEKARMALEDARYNKTKMRLRRDSQGNYTYQYVADEEKLGDLQAALADAQANLYNMDKEHYTQNLNTLYDAYKDYIDKMRDLTEEYNNTQDAEERARIQARIDLLKQSTNNLMQGLTEDNKYALQYLNESFFGGMGIDTTLLSADEQMEIMTQNIPQMQSNIQDLANTLVGEGGILNATNDAMKQISDATVEYDKNVKQFLTDAGSSLQVVTNVTDAAGNAFDKNIQQAESLITTNQKLIDECNAQVDAIQKLLSWLDQFLNKVMNVQTLISNLRGAYSTGQELNGSNLTADVIPVESMGLDTTAGMNFTGNPKTDAAAVKQQIDALMAQYEKFLTQMSIAKFDTGGSTGSWGDAEGRLAFLHEKELVLNQQDTANILAAVEAVRMITGSLNGLATGEIGSLINNATGLLGGIDNTSTLDQNVHIEANFPNVTQHTEIEQAFNNLVNMASMRASGYRD